MAIVTITANLNGGDAVTPNEDLTYKIYDYDEPRLINSTGSANTDANVSVIGDVVEIINFDIGAATEIQISCTNQFGQESVLSDVFTFAPPSTNYYVRPTGQTYGTGDGTSYANAWSGFTNIDWSVLDGETLAICGTHNEKLIVSQDNLTIIGNDVNESGVIDAQDSINNAVDVVSQANFTINDIVIENATISNINSDGTTTATSNNLTLRGSGNQGIQHYGQSQWTHNDIICENNTDDGVSTHDDANVTINRGTFSNNSEGIAVVNDSSVTANDIVNFSGNGVDFTSATKGSVTINNCTTSNTIRTRNGSTTIINNSNVQQIDNSSNSDISTIQINNTIVNGLIDTKNSNSLITANGCLILEEMSPNTSMVMEDCYYKPQTSSSDTGNITANRCLFDGDGSTDHILDLEADSNMNITNSVFANIPSGKYSIVLRGGTSSVDFDNNTLVGNGSTTNGVFVSGSASYTLNNNILIDLNNVDNNTGFTYNNCCIFNNNNTPNGTENNTISADPLLTDTANKDFSLGVGSPCIGAGVTTSNADGIDTAIWGNGIDELPSVTSKTQTAPFDVGAYVN